MIEQEKIRILYQLVGAMEDGCRKLESAFNSKELKKLEKAKKSILNSKKEIDKILNKK